MNKPIIAIFLAGNLATKDEEVILDKYAKFPCVIINAETYKESDSIVVDAVTGVVPNKLKHLPEPEVVIKQWQDFEAGLGANVGGLPPNNANDNQPPKQPDDNSGQNGFGVNGGVGGFGTPPVKDDKK